MAERDGFERYFAEKLWELLPAVYRHEDGQGARPGGLRALVELLAQQAARVRRSHDRLWEDQFIELCDDWAVPYLGDLVGTRLLSSVNRRGQRADVAKTLYYRRRSGTPAVLEELIADITGWEGSVGELFRRMLRTPHLLDPEPAAGVGSFTATLPGGLPDLRRPHGVERTGGPFDELHHTLDVRRHQGGMEGRYNLPKLAFHLYRLGAYEVRGVRPFRVDARRFVFDPSGREVPLFMRASRRLSLRETGEHWRRAREWELPAPMRCHVLGDARYQVDEQQVRVLLDAGLGAAAAAELRTLIGIAFPDERSLRDQLRAMPTLQAELAPPPPSPRPLYRLLLRGALVEECGKRALLAHSVLVDEGGGLPMFPELAAAASLREWLSTPRIDALLASAPRHLAIDPERGRFQFLDVDPAAPELLRVSYHYGFSGELGAGTYGRSERLAPPDFRLSRGGPQPAALALAPDATTQLEDSDTYGPLTDVPDLTRLTFQAASGQRPYVRLERDWVLTGAGRQASLVLDGLWLGGTGDLVLRGTFQQVTLRGCTLDPGGTDVLGGAIRPVRLLVEGHVEQLRIESSITASARVQGMGDVEVLHVRDSILHVLDPATGPAVSQPSGALELRRVTVLGGLRVHRLEASEALITGLVRVVDTQRGCFRFSAALEGSILPRPYASVSLPDDRQLFTSDVFGHPGYGQLREAAPESLRRGAENRSELGAFCGRNGPIRLDDLRAKVAEYMPFALIPAIILES
ncbi:hypothetical protein [Myxococcus sp. RHSTA-1-4]|uniref:hypothetical protein n=1 Tax=Myxococcus sp. RHSTA-1-4 TaxID=2874601 RepID=UPI001CBF3317|nr:hypothetical protein [Myxococcus sp. RHSTA-1-4]MBZ4420180.1 hypothetical protein [Myxococcus sp. RHSTA-1-4]